MRFGEVAATLPISDAAFHVGLTYAELLPGERRSALGMYFTPPALANRLLDQAEEAGHRWLCCKVLDPAAGSGVFLVLIAERILRALPPGAPREELEA
ncbi:MAG TPA: SAM-dependent methyltransferase, partial [Spirochaetia bacterium]